MAFATTTIEDGTIYVDGPPGRLRIGALDDVLDAYGHQKTEQQLRRDVRRETHSETYYWSLDKRDDQEPDPDDERRWSARMAFFLGGLGLRVDYGASVP